METTEKTLSETLAENLAYYIDNTRNRCVNKAGKCTYSGKTLRKKTQGCFVGKLMPEEDRIKADKFFALRSKSVHSIASGVTNLINYQKEIGIELPKIINDNLDLMRDFQELHDADYYFLLKKNLSDSGKIVLNRIIIRHKLDIKPFERFLK